MTDHSSPVSAEALLDLQRRAGIPHLPTQMTYEARLAVSNEGPRAYDWQDKPHRLVYDLCLEIEWLSIRAQCAPTKAVENAIREHFKSIGSSAVVSSDGIERVYYSGFSLTKLAETIASAFTSPGCSHPNAKVWMYRDDDTLEALP